MNKITALLRNLFERRRADRREVYLVCAALVLFVTMLAGDEGLEAALPYIVLLLICLVQFFRPTLMGWGFLTVLFWAYAVAVALHPQNASLGDYFIFLTIGLVPGVALLWCRPKPVAPSRFL